MNRLIYRSFAIAMLFVFLTGCGDPEPQKRQYQEVILAPPPSIPPGSAVAPSELPDSPEGPDLGPMTWKKPSHWTEEPGGGMRLVTFRSGSGEDTGECTIIVLGGPAGGYVANVKRWLGQINIQTDPAQLNKYVDGLPSMKTRGGHEGVFADLSLYNGDLKDGDSSMLTAIIRRGNQTVFVKMTGKKAYLAKEKTHFETLSTSIQ